MKQKRLTFIDLSIPIDNEAKEPFPPDIQYNSHEDGAEEVPQLFGVDASAFPNSQAWATESISLTTHTGTHVDAPWHYSPTSEGKPSKTIDQVPLEWFFSDGVVLNFSDKEAGYEISIDDLKLQLKKINYQLKPLDIVMIRTDSDKRYYETDYPVSHAGVSAEATGWLIDQGIKVVGIDAWGWDIPFHIQTEEYKKNPREGVLWAAHLVGREKEYCQIEKLANLDKLPKPYGFRVAVFPVNIKNASGGWARPVAIFEED